MINQFTSIRNSSAISSNHCEDVEFDADAETTFSRIRGTVTDTDSLTEHSDCEKVSPMPATNNNVCEESNEFSDLDGDMNATMGPMTATKTEMKINFSVDRLLSKNDADGEKTANANKLDTLWRNGQKSVLTIDQLLSTPSRNDHRQPTKQIVRPLPMRYLQSATVPAAVKSASTLYAANGPQSIHMQHYFKYINSNASNFNPLQYPKQSQQMPSVGNSPTVCSGGRYLDTYVTHKASFASADNSNAASSVGSTVSPTGHVKRKRSWSRAVFSQLQRKGLEIQFQIQKYITKPDRRKLAARLGLTDAQVKVWFQNRRMKWRHTRETKLNAEKKTNRQTNGNGTGEDTTNATSDDDDADDLCSADGSSDEDEIEIDVVAE